MNRATVLLFCLVANLLYADTCKYGLGQTFGSDTCSTREAEALVRVGSAKTICLSENTTVQWNKNSKEPTWAWEALRAGEETAIRDFSPATCEHADLVVRYVYDDSDESIKITVTHADSGAIVFQETRAVSDLSSDATRMATHFHDMVMDARAVLRSAQDAADEDARQRARQAALTLCDAEFETLKGNITYYLDQHVSLPQSVTDRMASHNKRCSNSISTDAVEAQNKADAEAKRAQDAADQETLREQARTARMDKLKADALIAWKQRLASAPFDPPTDGWVNVVDLPNVSYYIILPGKESGSSCHLEVDGSRQVLNCLGETGRNYYASVQSNGHWYLLKAKWRVNGEYAGSVKDGGNTLCIRTVGCSRVLAELREDASELPETFSVSRPGDLTLKYSNDFVAFSYPANWQTEEVKGKDKVITQVSVAPTDAHLGSWLTHGFNVGHIGQMSGGPDTLDGAFDQFTTLEKQNAGVSISQTENGVPVGDSVGKVAQYTSPSVLRTGESGWIAIVKDRGNGYYWIMMYYPSNDGRILYATTFGEIMKSFRFKQ